MLLDFLILGVASSLSLFYFYKSYSTAIRENIFSSFVLKSQIMSSKTFILFYCSRLEVFDLYLELPPPFLSIIDLRPSGVLDLWWGAAILSLYELSSSYYFKRLIWLSLFPPISYNYYGPYGAASISVFFIVTGAWSSLEVSFYSIFKF